MTETYSLKLSRLVGDIYQGVNEVSPWKSFLDYLVNLMNADISGLVFVRGNRIWEIITSADGRRDLSEKKKAELLCKRVAYEPQNASGVALTALVPIQLAASETIGKDISVQWPTVALVSCGSIESHIHVQLVVAKTRDKGFFSVAELEWMQLASKHVGYAATEYCQRKALAKDASANFDFLERLRIAALHVDGDAQILAKNAVVDELKSRGVPALVDGTRLAFCSDRIQAGFTEFLASLSERDGKGKSSCILVHNGVQVLVKRATINTASADDGFLVLVRQAGMSICPDSEALRVAFRLTQAEARVAVLLAQGFDVEETMSVLDIKKNTIKTHLKSLYIKFDVDTLAGLVHALTNNIAAFA